MAVQQISQIRVRTGLLQDLGQLAGGEFGWAQDQLRLFIGNGTIAEGAPYEGNTEIMTQKSLLEFYTGSTPGSGNNLAGLLEFSYRFKGLLGGYETQTGTSYGDPSVRTLQNKLDDNVNVHDFGAKGDGVTDDYNSIQRAIDQLYGQNSGVVPVPTRRVLNFHPGTYVIYGELKLPPYCVLKGAGKDSVIIRQASTASTYVFRCTNAFGNFDSSIATSGAHPGPVEVHNITWDMPLAQGRKIGRIDNSKNVLFNRCRFLGYEQRPTSDNAASCVEIDSTVLATNNVYFTECDFVNMSTAANISDVVGTSVVVFNRCVFTDLLRGIAVRTTRPHAPVGVKLISSVFNNVKEHAMTTGPSVTDVISSMNSYFNVGTNYASNVANLVSLGTVVPVTSVLKFGGNNSHSMGDVFLRPSDTEFTFPTVEHAAPEIISSDAQVGLRLGSRYQTIGRSYLLPINSVNYIPIQARFLSGVIHYNLERDQRYRSGTLVYTVDPINEVVCFRDSYTQVFDAGIRINMEYRQIEAYMKKPYLVIQTLLPTLGPTVITFDVKSQDYKQLVDSTVMNPVASLSY